LDLTREPLPRKLSLQTVDKYNNSEDKEIDNDDDDDDDDDDDEMLMIRWNAAILHLVDVASIDVNGNLC